MSLQLDERQRAMLLEMGVQVWLPGTAFATAAADAPAAKAQAPQRTTPAPTQMQAPERAHAPAATAPASGRPVPVAPAVLTPAAAAQTIDAAALDWAALSDTVAACKACGLCAGRQHNTLLAPTVQQQDWMVVGDPPDEDEDRAGQPFVQASGVLLDNMLKAVGATRGGAGAAGAYVTNVVKCRPPTGRLPQPAELAQCAGYLQREIALVQPKLIVAMGRFANQVLLSAQPELAAQPLGKLRGNVYRYHGVPVVVTYAPKVLLRAPSDKGKAWADLCLAMDTLEAL
jgi:uracil-DNA glycosylase family 4